MSGPLYHYKDALLLAQSRGPVNLSGLARDLKPKIEQAEQELVERSLELHSLERELIRALDAFDMRAGPGLSTGDRNRDPEVKRIVGEMVDLGFDTDKMTQVGSHCLVRLFTSYMAQLSGYICRDPYYLDRWGSAVKEAEAKVLELGGELVRF